MTFSVLNVTSGPSTVPPELFVTTRKWYSVFGVRPTMDADTVTGLVPDPGSDLHGAFDPYLVLVPYSNSHSVTFCPSGFTLAFRVAEVWVRKVTALLLKAPSPFGAPTPEGPSKPMAASHAVVPSQSMSPYISLMVGSPHGPGASPSQ